MLNYIDFFFRSIMVVSYLKNSIQISKTAKKIYIYIEVTFLNKISSFIIKLVKYQI